MDEFSAGYGKVAAIQDLEPDFLMYRRFSWLRNYVLLHLQDELVEMQDSLERLDRWEFGDGDHKALLSRRRDYRREVLKRKDILTKVRSKLAEYGETDTVCHSDQLFTHMQMKSYCERRRFKR